MDVSILDQTQLIDGESSETEFNNTVALAQYLDELGYTRYWLSEHHSTDALAGSAPEILASFLLAKTKNIRVGSGGVMLPHYSSYKVSEMFNVMSALAPGRVDLGVGRAPGGHHLSNIALQSGVIAKRNVDQFPQKLDEIAHYFRNKVPEDSVVKGLQTTPKVNQPAVLWLLGTSNDSAKLAAKQGLPYVFAHFINYEAGAMDEAIALYRAQFQPSTTLSHPKVIVAIKTILADTDEYAQALAKSAVHANFYLHRGVLSRLVSPDKALSEVHTKKEWAEVQAIKDTYLIGSKQTVAKQLKELKSKLNIDEVMTLSPIYDFESRKYSLKLLKEVTDTM
ncbi:LLM class flavin-dependent oxidoreductase [Staphylococcus sp. ACRSN]|mgnify:CR=1 FL=1|uniref:LLM class flavin-dependent oxidoreductase n=1 Tax=Staphylococcus sp. ACRSN TaxID=2918214 RepID=UPI001EF2ACE4|nr:LLM class flavin-dependent oxidoreductase [Staphylococcus sp. ACRSN]MCG7337852.1 LLM class flavin-dependent oxidoreductase [Staphylococcus sp. ACRSN]